MIRKSVDTLFDTCYNGVVSLANAALVSSGRAVDAASQEIQRDSVQGAIREAFTDSGYAIVRQRREVYVNEASTSVAVNVTVPRERFFYWFLSADLPRIMRAYAILPGVASTCNQTGPMHQVGVTRQILFLDGTSAVEEITDSDPPRSLDYRVHSLTSAFHYLVRDGTARIAFSASSPQETTVEWRYTFQGHNWLAALILRPLVLFFWRGFLRATLMRAKQLAEAEGLSSANPNSAA